MEREGATIIRLTIPHDRERWQQILERRPDAACFEGFLGAEVEVDLTSAEFVKPHRWGRELLVRVTRASGHSVMMPTRIVQAMAQTQFGLEGFAKMFRVAFSDHANRTQHRAPSGGTEPAPML